MINIDPIPAFKDNYIWTIHDLQHAVVVDPGDAAPVRAWLDKHRCRLAAILCTHHHNDHVGGICELAQLYNVPVYGPANENIPCITHPVQEGSLIEISKPAIRLEVLDIPGHTLGHVAYLGRMNPGEAESLFCGDTLFGCGCGRLFEGTAAQLHHSLQRLARLPDETKVYCAHEYTEANIRFALACEPHNILLAQRREHTQAQRSAGKPSVPSTIALEKDTNPFLRCSAPEILQILRVRGWNEANELGAFTALREWRNHF